MVLLSDTNQQVDKMGVALFVFIVAYPIFVTSFLYVNLEKLESEEFKVKFDSLYLKISTKSFLKVLQTPIFLIRRLLMSLIIVLLSTSSFAIQIICV
jgi:hypothetical protein